MNEVINTPAVPVTPAVAPAPTANIAPRKPCVIASLADKLSVDHSKLTDLLKKTAFSTCRNDEEFMAMCMVANTYNLNPVLKEIYAFPSKNGAVVPMVGVDGWIKLCNINPNFDGMEFEEAEDGAWCECIIYRKDRTRPVKAREWLKECSMGTMPWQKFPRRMLRNKALVQCARMAFGFAGIYDPDEAVRIEDTALTATPTPKLANTPAAQIELSPTATQKRPSLRAALGIGNTATAEKVEVQ